MLAQVAGAVLEDPGDPCLPWWRDICALANASRALFNATRISLAYRAWRGYVLNKERSGRKMKLLERETPGHSWVSVNKAWKTVRIRNRKIHEKLLKIAQVWSIKSVQKGETQNSKFRAKKVPNSKEMCWVKQKNKKNSKNVLNIRNATNNNQKNLV